MSVPGQPLVVGTRGSALALAQTTLVCDALRARFPTLALRVEQITTTGDARADLPLSALGRGMFVTEIETALREGRIHFAVHSAKDLPSTLAPDLTLAAFLPRADARDVLVSPYGTLDRLPRGARVGTSSPRRACLVRSLRPDVVTVEIRGNVDTRLRKLAAGEFDAIVLAAAGLERLGRSAEATELFAMGDIPPCPGQGALAIEARRDDGDTIALLAPLDDADTRVAVETERAFLAELGAGCRAAVAAHAEVRGPDLHLCGMIGVTDGRSVRGARVAPRGDGPHAAVELARELMLDGGAAFLAPRSSALAGKRVAVTRAEAQAGALVALLAARGAVHVPCPTIAIAPVADETPIDRELRRLEGVAWIVFTSMNAVTALAERVRTRGVAVPRATRFAAVGRATAAEVRRRFGRVDFVPSAATAETLGRELPIGAGQVVLFARGSIASGAMPALLRERGAVTREVVVYRTVPGPGAERLAELVRTGDIDAIVFTSPSSLINAGGIGAAFEALGAAAPRVVSMGPSTTQAARAAGIVAHEPPTPALGALVETLETLFTEEPATHA